MKVLFMSESCGCFINQSLSAVPSVGHKVTFDIENSDIKAVLDVKSVVWFPDQRITGESVDVLVMCA